MIVSVSVTFRTLPTTNLSTSTRQKNLLQPYLTKKIMDGIVLQSGGRFRKVEELCSKVGDVSARLRNRAPKWETFPQG